MHRTNVIALVRIIWDTLYIKCIWYYATACKKCITEPITQRVSLMKNG